MTYFEAQQIIDKIDSKTIIDANWLDYLLVEKGLITLQALQIVTEKTWLELIFKYEGQEISVFQTEVIENYIGKQLELTGKNYTALIIGQNSKEVFYFDHTFAPTTVKIKYILNSTAYKII